MFDTIREACTFELPYGSIVQYWIGNPFTDRESYFEWVRQWKETYKSLTQEIRELKAQIRAGEYEGPTWRIQSSRGKLRLYATALLILRHEGKIRSWEMKQGQLENTSKSSFWKDVLEKCF